MLACTACSADLPPHAKFCLECGTPVAVRACPSCGTPAERGRFCAECGTEIDLPRAAPVAPVAPVSERRVTSVLFGDLVGFTTLSENRDAEEVRELLSQYFSRCRVVIGRYGGTVEKFIGDAVMAVWGVPVAHEDDAERAVRAGLELVGMVTALGEEVGARGLQMRVGVVTGEVAVTVGATAEGMVAGDAVNTASRVQSTARPGEVWVDDTTRSLTIATVTYADEGEHELKGKAEPLRLFSAGAVVAGVRGGQRVDGLEAPHTGRDRELRLLKELFHTTAETLRPRLVVVDGEAGVGKSRLVWEFEKYVDGLTATTLWHRGRCLSYGDGVAFWALSEAVRVRLDLTEADAGDIVGARLEAALERYVPDAADRGWLRPRLASLVGAESGGAFVRDDLFAAWATFFERIGEDQNPVVLVIDDAQHADDGLLDFIDHLLATARAGILVVALARPELLARRHDLGGRRATAIRLEPLHDDDMRVLVDGLVSGLSPSSRDALVDRAEGVPLFAVETVRALIDRDLVVPRDGRYVPAEGADLDLEAVGAPASLQALVAARLDALSPDERSVVADASVLGATFPRDGLEALWGGSDLDAVLTSLQRKEVFTLQSDRLSAERGQYKFVQAVVRQVAYATQSRRDRKQRHLAAAAYLESRRDEAADLAVVIAQHVLDAIESSAHDDTDIDDLSARAVVLLDEAAARAASLGAHAEAQRLLELALFRAPATQVAADLHLRASLAARLRGDMVVSVEHAVAARAGFSELGDVVGEAAATGYQARAALGQGDGAGAVALAQPCLDRIERLDGADVVLIDLHSSLASAFQGMGRFTEMGHHNERALLLAEKLGDMPALSGAYSGMGVRYLALGAPQTSLAMYENAVSTARACGALARLAGGLVNIASASASRDLARALDVGREAAEVGRRAGSVYQVDFARFNYLLALWTAGRLEEARALQDELTDSVAESSIAASIPATGIWLAEALGERLPDEGYDGTSDNVADLAWMTDFDMLRARADGDLARAAALAEESMGHAVVATSLEDDFMHLWPPSVRSALEAGDQAAAERLLALADEAPPALLSPGVAAILPFMRGLVRIGRGDDADLVETDLRRSITLLDDFGALSLRGRAEESLGRWLVAQDRQVDASTVLDRARATYQEIGARGWLADLNETYQPASARLGLSSG
jgi:class 3 adenylate cyclase/tetratricopeptide (TPR) repeat protein